MKTSNDEDVFIKGYYKVKNTYSAIEGYIYLSHLQRKFLEISQSPTRQQRKVIKLKRGKEINKYEQVKRILTFRHVQPFASVNGHCPLTKSMLDIHAMELEKAKSRTQKFTP